MSVIRLIHVKIAPDQMAEAERIWKEECAPLMIRRDGCVSEQLLKCLDVEGEYISYSEWANDDAVERYRNSEEHAEIRRHTRNLQGARAEVKRYGKVD